MSVDWSGVAALPAGPRAAMRALRFDRPDVSGLDTLAEKEWKGLLGWLDRQQMTLLFGDRCAGRLPNWVAERIEGNRQANRIRLDRLRQEYGAVAQALDEARIAHTALKGFSHAPPYVPAAELRPQYDLDLLVAPEDFERARRALAALGFESANERDTAPADHSPPLVRRTGWRWRADYFDTEIPPVVELHYQLWDSATEGFDMPALADPAFEPSGSPVYAAAHALRHLLRGSLKALHVYEIARFLHESRSSGAWPAADGPQAIVFSLAQRWFGCSLPPPVAAAADGLPSPVRAWLERYAASPLTKELRANKDELWLHFELARDWRSAVRIARRRLAPFSLPGALDGHYDKMRPSAPERARRAARYAGYTSRRLGFHAVSLGKTALEAVRWSQVRKESLSS